MVYGIGIREADYERIVDEGYIEILLDDGNRLLLISEDEDGGMDLRGRDAMKKASASEE